MLTRNYLKGLNVEGDKIDSIIEAHVETVEGLKSKIAEAQAEAESFKNAATERDKYKNDFDVLKGKYTEAQNEVKSLKDIATERDSLKTELEKANEALASMQGVNDNLTGVTQERDQLKTEVDDLKAEIEKFNEKETASNQELEGLKQQLATFETDKANALAELEQLKAESEQVKGEYDAFKTQVATEKENATKREIVRNALNNGGVARSDFQDLILNSIDLNSVKFGDDGIEDVDAFIETTKDKYPSCFGTVTETGTPPVQPISGTHARKFTLEQIKNMSPEEINQNWEAVQKTIAKGV